MHIKEMLTLKIGIRNSTIYRLTETGKARFWGFHGDEDWSRLGCDAV